MADCAREIADELRDNLFRAEFDNKEKENGNITWRRYSAKDQVSVDAGDAQMALERMRGERMMDNIEGVGLPLE